METRGSKVKGKPGWGGDEGDRIYNAERSADSGDEQYSRKKYESQCGESASWTEVERSGGGIWKAYGGTLQIFYLAACRSNQENGWRF